jgi:hypothetical protein
MDNKDKGYTYTFYALVSAGVVGLFGGLYSLFNYFSDEEQLSDTQNIQVEEIKQEFEEASGKLTFNLAVQIMAMTNKLSEDILKKLHPDIYERRRKALANPIEYDNLCNEYLEVKNHAYMSASKTIMNKFGVKEEDFQTILQNTNPMEFEQKVIQYEKPEFDREFPQKEEVKKAFLEYSSIFMEEMKGFRSLMAQLQNNPQQQELAFAKLLTLKLKVDDIIYTKYQLNEHQIRYLLYQYCLLNDPDVIRSQSMMGKFEEMLGYT